ncbi:hypothetical protein [Carnobacterium sp. ISL-102]|uniref:hypothetical protein n=1 Tax=Carnobacterium sp. ISL-102 TaxID=2819142 RepID=UPI001BE97C1C|nr:hypothetical protein [Carnobacterium sp. ISL-102]MBT2731653.1 hypothetical protein [Carnobacterium sp. ISL-102]
MAKIDDDLISTYFYIQKRIDRAKERIEESEKEFKHKNFYTGVQVRYEKMQSVAFKLEAEVIDHVDAITLAEKHIKTLQFKLKHFNHFLNGLNSLDRNYFTNRYKYDYEGLNDRLDSLIIDEVKEIEEAANHCFKQEKATMYRVGSNKSNEEKLTDFSNMLEVLGV